MEETLRTSLIQTDLIWNNPEENRKLLEKKILPLKGLTDLVVLPEAFTTGFSFDFFEDEKGPTLKWMKELSKATGILLMGSVFVKTSKGLKNRCHSVCPDGQIFQYDKAHLFPMGDENQKLQPGLDDGVFSYGSWRIRPAICYDLRFPVWLRNQENYDLLVFMANWPAARSNAWTTLLGARAIENQAYVLGCNRLGTDGKGVVYNGNSAIFDFEGNFLGALENGQDTLTKELSLESLKKYRHNFPAWKDQDRFHILQKED